MTPPGNTSRAIRELAIVKRLEWLAEHRPAVFAKAMLALAAIEAADRRRRVSP